MLTEIKVTQGTTPVPTKPMPVEVLAEHIAALSSGVRKIMAGPLNERAVVLLRHHSSGVSQKEVKAVLHGIQSLERDYLKPGR